MKYEEHKKARVEAKNKLGKYGRFEVTWKSFDCGLDKDGLENACEECVVCKYRNFIEYAESVGKPEGSTIGYNKFIEKYLEMVY